MGRHLSYKRGPQILLNCGADCWWSNHQARCIARGQQLCQVYNLVDCGLHRAVCKWRHGACVVKQNACDHRCQRGVGNTLDCVARP